MDKRGKRKPLKNRSSRSPDSVPTTRRAGPRRGRDGRGRASGSWKCLKTNYFRKLAECAPLSGDGERHVSSGWGKKGSVPFPVPY